MQNQSVRVMSLNSTAAGKHPGCVRKRKSEKKKKSISTSTRLRSESRAWQREMQRQQHLRAESGGIPEGRSRKGKCGGEEVVNA